MKKTTLRARPRPAAGSLLPVSALAATWYLEDGDIIIRATKDRQTVSQGEKTEIDNAPVIKQNEQNDSSTATDKTIKIETTGGATADVTIENVNISSGGDAIDVGSSSADITLEGENKIFSESGSALHVSSGNVTIDGNGSLEAGNGDETAYSQRCQDRQPRGRRYVRQHPHYRRRNCYCKA